MSEGGIRDLKTGTRGRGSEGDVSLGSEWLTCRHHWLIESPDGPTSLGVCRICGLEREFDNNFEQYAVDNNGHAYRGIQTAVSQPQDV